MIRCAGRSVLVAVLLLASRGAVMGGSTRVALVVLLLIVSACAPRGSEQTLGSLMSNSAPARSVSGPWVLWLDIGERDWSRQSGYETAGECELQIERLTEQIADVARGEATPWGAVQRGRCCLLS